MAKVNLVIIGTGSIARHHLRGILKKTRTTRLQALVEISEESRNRFREFFKKSGFPCPPFYNSLGDCLKNGPPPDAALITTPHKFHFGNIRECLRAGLDVLVEKPMVLNEREARAVIRLRNETGRLVVVGFNGSLSPAIEKAKKLLAAGLIGRVTGVSAHVHQNWKKFQTGTWRQNPEISGGGFLFDTGSHMVNTVVDLIGEDVKTVSAVFDNCGAPVEINSAVGGQFRSGVLFSLAAFGDATHCKSEIRIFGGKGVLETGIWGEKLLHLSDREEAYKPIPYRKGIRAWDQFLRVRSGKIENPSPPEIGLRFARLMDMIRKSAESGKRIT